MPPTALQDLTNKTAAQTSASLVFLGGTKTAGERQIFQYKSLAARPAAQHLTQRIIPADQSLQETQLDGASLVVLVCDDTSVPKKTLRALQDAVKQQGCSLLVLLGRQRATACKRINLLLQKFHLEATGAAVISSSPQRYMHPQEVLLIDCITNQRLRQRVGQVC